MTCIALCNMSSSESFGIVLLEAWLAGKPVIANKNCVAFHDMAIDGDNALLVEQQELADAIRRLLGNPKFGRKLAENGKKLASEFDWNVVCENFLAISLELSQD